MAAAPEPVGVADVLLTNSWTAGTASPRTSSSPGPARRGLPGADVRA
jgi:hypothetical protein